jgi:hypothetical protein
MFDWLRKKKDAPLTGAPAVRRQKTYSAESGYVYQYFYEGQRPAARDGAAGAQYVFNVSADRKSSVMVSVFLSEAALEGWQTSHERLLISSERYAVAKMALFQAFDRRGEPTEMTQEVRVVAEDVDAILATLDIA